MRVALICLVLVFANLFIYARSMRNGFVDFDDRLYVVDNAAVQQGLTLDGVRWSLTTWEGGYWHPVTWVSHMIDGSLFGVNNAGGHHGASMVYHMVNSLLLFGALRALTGSLWRSALVALLFAVHPLRVESVAWAAQRKDLLFAGMWFGAMWAYAGYVRRPTVGRYLAVMGLFCLGLMSKPMMVTLPFALLLLDYWPLGRWRGAPRDMHHGGTETRRIAGEGNTDKDLSHKLSVSLQLRGNSETSGLAEPVTAKRLILEKLPLVAMSVMLCLGTFYSQNVGHALASSRESPMVMRVGNAAVSYVRYLGKTFWPMDLAVIYPHPAFIEGAPPLVGWQIAASAGLLLVMTILVWRYRRLPYLLMGWFWFLGVLLPVIGLISHGAQAYADRYMYVPQIGLLIMLVWGLRDWAADHARRRRMMIGLAVVMASSFMLRAGEQVGVWRDGVTLFEHNLKVTGDNYIVHKHLGGIWLLRGDRTRGLEHYRKAVAFRPKDEKTLCIMARELRNEGQFDKAMKRYRQVLSFNPDSPQAYNGLGVIYMMQKQYPKAIGAFDRVLKLDPQSVPGRLNRENAVKAMQERSLLRQGRLFRGWGRLIEPIEQLRGEISQNQVSSSAANGVSDFQSSLLKIQQASLASGVEHRVFAADVIGSHRHTAGSAHLMDDVQVGGCGFDHDHVGALGEVCFQFDAPFPGAAEVHLITPAIAELHGPFAGIAKRAVKVGGILNGVSKDGGVLMVGGIERSADGCDLAIDHARRCDDICASVCLGDGSVSEYVQCAVVVDDEVWVIAQNTAVAVAGVLTKTKVRVHDDVESLLTHLRQYPIHRRVGRCSEAAGFVFLIRRCYTKKDVLL